jgi:hypothetical protein
MNTYKVVSRNGRTTFISAYTESDAFQQANDFCGDDGILEFGLA